MNLTTKILVSVIISFGIFINFSYASINFMVSPIKYEIDAELGDVITKSAKLINLSDKTIYITTGVSNFESKSTDGKPTFIKKDNTNITGKEISDWITINEKDFEIGPKKEKNISFTIKVPENATPGGHYGAVFFKNNKLKSSGQISINIDYGVLLLINIAGEVISKANILDFIIVNNDSVATRKEKDKCFLNIDITENNYDGKCLYFSTNLFKASLLNTNIEITNDNSDKNFIIEFEIPIENEGNTHIKPVGKIELIDEDGNKINSIGKKIIQNSKGAIIGEEIVNYLPVNDVLGNILPSSKRIFNTQWKGFPYKKYDEDGNQIIQYWNPNEYYSQKNIAKQTILMPWERIKERINYKDITALLEINYNDNNGEEIEFNSAKEFTIEYNEKYIGLNPLVIIGSIFILFITFFTWLIFRKKKIKCKSCSKNIEKEMKICPYCGEKNKISKHKIKKVKKIKKMKKK